MRYGEERVRSSKNVKKTPGRKGIDSPGPCQKLSLHNAKRYADPFSHNLIQARTSYDRTGGHRRIEEKAGDTIPARAPAVCIPEQVIR